jgi:hypothetical protein
MNASTSQPLNLSTSLVRQDVDRGLAIVAEMAKLQGELDAIETRLEVDGLHGEQVELNDPDREGRQYLARGSKSIVPVVFTADLLVQSFQDDSDIHHRIVAALPVPKDAPNPDFLRSKLLRCFFRPVFTFKTLLDSGKKFRAQAAELLGKDAPAFISACLQRDKEGIPKSKVVVAWDRAEEIKAEGAAS